MAADGEVPLPSFDELAARPGAPPSSSWGLWGPGDALGCFNLAGPERARRGAGLVRRGAVFPLNLSLDLPDPPLFGRSSHEHRVTWLTGEVGHDEELSGWNPQRSSQWDGFRHVRSRAFGFYNGLDDEAHGVHHWAERGLVTRGVLADVERWRRARGRPLVPDQRDVIEPGDLLGCLADQGVVVEAGDVLLVRTGWLAWYRTLDAAGRRAVAGNVVACGLRPGRSMARVLWDLHVAAVCADNPAVEPVPIAGSLGPEERRRLQADPAADAELFLHSALLPLLGMPLGELWDLDALAADCAGDGVYDFLLTSAPLNLPAGVGSPANALAVK